MLIVRRSIHGHIQESSRITFGVNGHFRSYLRSKELTIEDTAGDPQLELYRSLENARECIYRC